MALASSDDLSMASSGHDLSKSRGSTRLEQLDAFGVPVDPPRDEGPDIGHEEVLRLLFLNVLELQVWELLQDGNFRHTHSDS